MVFTAFVIFTVSTLAVHGMEESTAGPVVPRGCEGDTFCNIKPADYPQKEIDQYLEKNPAFLKRMKRAALSDWRVNCDMKNEYELEEPSEDGNCETDTKCESPFSLKMGNLSHVIVQSNFFKQTVRQVRCVSQRACFKALIKSARCEQKSVSTTLYIFDTVQNRIKKIEGQIYVDCACVLYNGL